jgi:hypothetical protein
MIAGGARLGVRRLDAALLSPSALPDGGQASCLPPPPLRLSYTLLFQGGVKPPHSKARTLGPRRRPFSDFGWFNFAELSEGFPAKPVLF